MTKKYKDLMNSCYNDNYKWKLDDIIEMYEYENPSWDEEICRQKAREVYRELKNMNRKLWDDNGNYYKFFKPFSFYESEDGTWSSIPELEEV